MFPRRGGEKRMRKGFALASFSISLLWTPAADAATISFDDTYGPTAG